MHSWFPVAPKIAGASCDEEPAVGELVVHSDDVAAVDRGAVAAEVREERVAVEGPGERRAALVEDLEGEVDPLEDVVRPDRHRRVGGLDVVHVGGALEVGQRRGHARPPRCVWRTGSRSERREREVRRRPLLHLDVARARSRGGCGGRAICGSGRESRCAASGAPRSQARPRPAPPRLRRRPREGRREAAARSGVIGDRAAPAAPGFATALRRSRGGPSAAALVDGRMRHVSGRRRARPQRPRCAPSETIRESADLVRHAGPRFLTGAGDRNALTRNVRHLLVRDAGVGTERRRRRSPR